MSTQRVRDAMRDFAEWRERVIADEANQAPNLLDRDSWTEPASPPAGWLDQAATALHALALTHDVFTVEDLRLKVAWTYDLRSLGAVLRLGVARGWMTAGEWVSGGSERHGRPIRQWRSRLRGGDQ